MHRHTLKHTGTTRHDMSQRPLSPRRTIWTEVIRQAAEMARFRAVYGHFRKFARFGVTWPFNNGRLFGAQQHAAAEGSTTGGGQCYFGIAVLLFHLTLAALAPQLNARFVQKAVPM